MTLESVAGYIGIKHISFFIGFIGGVVSLSFLKNCRQTVVGKSMMVVGGATTAGYMEPPISAYFSLENGGYVAFIIGLFGMSVAAAIMQLIQKTKWAYHLNKFLNKKFGD